MLLDENEALKLITEIETKLKKLRAIVQTDKPSEVSTDRMLEFILSRNLSESQRVFFLGLKAFHATHKGLSKKQTDALVNTFESLSGTLF